MNNSVTLYKTKYTLTSYEQPYFTSPSSRDSYLSTCSPYVVNLNQPAIHFDFNLDLELVLPLDYTVAQSYNFAKVIYNSKDYFAYIVDMQQLSVGNVKVLLHRAVLFEVTNYLDKFKNFNISKSTFSSGYAYNRNTKYFLPDFRYYTKIKDLTNNIYLSIKIGSSYQKLPCSGYKNFLLVYLAQNYQYDDSNYTVHKPNSANNLYGFPKNYSILCIPVFNSGRGSINKTYTFLSVNGSGPTTINTVSVDTHHVFNENIANVIDKLSPYISSIHYVRLPVFSYNDSELWPFYLNPPNSQDASGLFLYTQYIHESVSFYTYLGFFLGYSSTVFTKINDIEIEINCECENQFGEIDVKAYSPGVSIRLNKSKILDGAIKTISIKLKYYTSQNEFMFFYSVDGYTKSIFGDETIRDFLDTQTSISFNMDTEASFNAENRYYDALTNSAKNQRIAKGTVQFFENSLLSASQRYGASKMVGNYSTDLQTASNSNAVRAGGNVADTIIDAYYYEEQRKFNKKNEQAKPDQSMLASDTFAVIGEYDYIYMVEEIPFTEDYNEWQSNIKIFGIDCNAFEVSIDLSSKIVDNNFFLQAVATMSDNSTLDLPTYSELYSLLSKGCVYNYYST